jgi:hypothetical protein
MPAERQAINHVSVHVVLGDGLNATLTGDFVSATLIGRVILRALIRFHFPENWQNSEALWGIDNGCQSATSAEDEILYTTDLPRPHETCSNRS